MVQIVQTTQMVQIVRTIQIVQIYQLVIIKIMMHKTKYVIVFQIKERMNGKEM